MGDVLEMRPATYSTSVVAKLVGVPAGRVRSLVRRGFVSPARDERGAIRFSVQELGFLRTALEAASSTLRRLKENSDRPLSTLDITRWGNQIVVRDGSHLWDAGLRQLLFPFFSVKEMDDSDTVPLVVNRDIDRERREEPDLPSTAEGWFELGCQLEETAPKEAEHAYRCAVELFPGHADAHVNLGRLLHAGGDLAGAESHYQAALLVAPDDAVAAFNLGVVLEDGGNLDGSLRAYQMAVAADATCADAYFNLARVCEQLGQQVQAIRHLKVYKKLMQGD